jgi:DNA ligase (NAD+)
VPRGEETRIEQIAIQVGRTGVLTPVALMRPVEVGGVTISRATLHNREELQRKNIRRGDLVRIQRAGDVIPEVAERIAEPRRGRKPLFKMPAKCPACGSPVVERGPYTLCPNHFGCPAQLKGRIRHFGSREGLDIEGLGDETVSALIDHGLVRDVAGIFRLKKEDLFGSKDLPSARPRNSSTRSTIAGASGLANSSTLWEFQRSVPPWREISRKSSAALKV